MTETARPRAIPPDVEDIRARATDAIQPRFPGARVLPLVQFTGGTSSLTYRADVEGASVREVVVKAAPAGLPPVRNRDVLRQARILQALAAVDGVAVAEVFGYDSGGALETPPLFVMELLPGESYEPKTNDLAEAPPDDVVRTRATKAVRMLARMHAATVGELGVDDEPVGSIPDEVERWRTAAASCELRTEVATLERQVYERLIGSVPAQLQPAVLHGDWRLGNMQCTGADINGVIDWEIWSVGDPRIDLAWMQLMADPLHPSVAYPQAATLTPTELAAEYDAAAGTDVAAMDWFGALVRYKQAAVSMLLVKNAAKRGELDDRYLRMDDAISGLLQAAADRLG